MSEQILKKLFRICQNLALAGAGRAFGIAEFSIPEALI